MGSDPELFSLHLTFSQPNYSETAEPSATNAQTCCSAPSATALQDYERHSQPSGWLGWPLQMFDQQPSPAAPAKLVQLKHSRHSTPCRRVRGLGQGRVEFILLDLEKCTQWIEFYRFAIWPEDDYDSLPKTPELCRPYVLSPHMQWGPACDNDGQARIGECPSHHRQSLQLHLQPERPILSAL